MANTQLLKGVLEGCVLFMIAEEEVYGYQLVQKLRKAGFTDIVGGTVYPVLQKLEKKACIIGEIKPSTEGPDRKYYTITAEGLRVAHVFQQEWQEFSSIVNQFMKRGEEK